MTSALNLDLAQLLVANDVDGWIEATKGRIYDFSKDLDRTYTSTDTGNMISNSQYVRDEMADWLRKRGKFGKKPTKSWLGTPANLLKNINAQRYKKLDWDMAERVAHQKAVKTKKSAPKTTKSKVNQNDKRRQATMYKNANKILPDFTTKHIARVKAEMEAQAQAQAQAVAYTDWMADFSELAVEQYGENVPNRRGPKTGKKWYMCNATANAQGKKLIKAGNKLHAKHMKLARKRAKVRPLVRYATKQLARQNKPPTRTMDSMSLPPSPYW